MSFFPKSQADYRFSVRMLRMNLTQTFGEEPDPAAFDEPYHVLTPFYRDGHSTVARLPHYFLDLFCKGDAERLHESGGRIGRSQRAVRQPVRLTVGKCLRIIRRQQPGTVRQIHIDPLPHRLVRFELHLVEGF